MLLIPTSPAFPTTDNLPVVKGIQLIGTHQLPDRIKPIFPFPAFNAVQSKCFKAVYRSSDNFVLSSPTGSGKTAILELAICHLVANTSSSKDFKVVYQAPTKSLCSERHKDWSAKFTHLGLKCAELTGDTEHGQLKSVQQADILITTPEKWDSMTRKWRDHRKLMELVRLFLIDEVHILKEDRGATLEAIVSRMKSVGTDVRFVALSATVPNSEDIATWLGRSNRVPGMPAAREIFGEDFRPVKLQRHVVGIPSKGGNDFAFEATCNTKLTSVIETYTTRLKPIMVFCMTRKSTEATALLLSKWWTESQPAKRWWDGPKATMTFKDQALKGYAACGVTFHHAGLDYTDRITVERGYLDGDINVICCTSTLAVGVNLPCHLVIIKNTVAYQDSGCKEYSDLEVMQMLGRAGRPQFDHSAVAVIMTRLEKVQRYEKMVSGEEILESKLHLNLIEHLNAEIGLGTIRDVKSAMNWLQGTFLYVRFQKNPSHYRLEGNTGGASLDELVKHICNQDLDQLREYYLITQGDTFKTTEFGDVMARYYVQFETMKLIMGLQPKARTSEILSALAQATEFKSIRFRSGEKQLFKDINSSPSIKFPIPVDLALTSHKVSLMIQAVLSGIDTREDRFGQHRTQFVAETATIFQHIHRLTRCIIDCSLHREDSVAARNALEFARSLAARIWDDSPLQLTQVEGIGPVAARKLIGANIRTIEDLEDTPSQRIDTILSKHPPYGNKLLHGLESFPKLRISLHKVGQPKSTSVDGLAYLNVDIKAEVGFLNDTPPQRWGRFTIQMTLLAETSDGTVIHFCRVSAQKIGFGENILFSAKLTSPQQLVNCYIACEDIVGTLRSASLKPGIAASAFPLAKPTPESRLGNVPKAMRPVTAGEGFCDADIDDRDLEFAADGIFADVDELSASPAKLELTTTSKEHTAATSKVQTKSQAEEPERLPNGKWKCSHQCKDKQSCKHICCKEGMDSKPKLSKKKQQEKVEKNEPRKTGVVDDFFKPSGLPHSAPKFVQQSGHPKASDVSREARGSKTRLDKCLEVDAFDDLDEIMPGKAQATKPRVLLPAKLESSASGLFLSSSPDKRSVEVVNLLGEPSLPSLITEKCDFEDELDISEQSSQETPPLKRRKHAHDYASGPKQKLDFPKAYVNLAELEKADPIPVGSLGHPESCLSPLIGARAEIQHLDDQFEDTIFDDEDVTRVSALVRPFEGDEDVGRTSECEPELDISRRSEARTSFESVQTPDQIEDEIPMNHLDSGSRDLHEFISQPSQPPRSGHAVSCSQRMVANKARSGEELVSDKSNDDKPQYSLPKGYDSVDQWLLDEFGDCVEFI